MFKRWFQPPAADGEFGDEAHRNGAAGSAIGPPETPREQEAPRGPVATMAPSEIATASAPGKFAQFDEIYRTSDPELRQRQSPSTFIAYLRDSQARLVNTKSRRQFHTGVVLERDHATVEFDYDVDVGNAIVSEEISWIIRDRATLLGYYLEAKTSR